MPRKNAAPPTLDPFTPPADESEVEIDLTDEAAADPVPEPGTVNMPTVDVLPLDAIRPYWRNPREIPEAAVAAVTQSIRDYGYQQPIVVDSESVIIVGHTRYAALRRLGVEQVPVIVATDLSPDKVREYRVMDNRSGEFSMWDESALLLELREFNVDLLATYFPDVDLEIDTIETARKVTQDDVDKAAGRVADVGTAEPRPTTTITCPSCFHEFNLDSNSIA